MSSHDGFSSPRADQIPKKDPETDIEVRELNDNVFEVKLPGKMNELVSEGEPVESITTRVLLPETLPPQSEPLRVVLSIHGQGASSELNDDLFNALVKSGVAVVAPTTSRRSGFNPETSGDFNAWMASSFEGKDYEDEVGDFSKGTSAGLDTLRDQLGDRELEITLIGYSLGGTMATTLSEQIDIRNLILVAPALSGLEADQPLVGERHPDRETLVNQAGSLDNVTVIRGDQDPFISVDDAMAYANDSATYKEIKGAGHTFGALPFLPGDGENKRKELIESIISSI